MYRRPTTQGHWWVGSGRNVLGHRCEKLVRPTQCDSVCTGTPMHGGMVVGGITTYHRGLRGHPGPRTLFPALGQRQGGRVASRLCGHEGRFCAGVGNGYPGDPMVVLTLV